MMTVENILARHDEGIYHIHHWTGFIKPSVTARQACRKIRAQLEAVMEVAAKDGQPLEGLKRMSAMANLLIQDLWDMPAAEYEELRQLNDEELMNRVPYTPGAQMAPWLAKEGRNLRFEK